MIFESFKGLDDELDDEMWTGLLCHIDQRIIFSYRLALNCDSIGGAIGVLNVGKTENTVHKKSRIVLDLKTLHWSLQHSARNT